MLLLISRSGVLFVRLYARVSRAMDVEEMQHLLGLGSGRDDIQKCRQRVGMFGISGELATMPIAVLSGGQKARVQFARVCAPQPHILVLDEPTNHLGAKRLPFLCLTLDPPYWTPRTKTAPGLFAETVCCATGKTTDY
jgi:alpha-D-ribose 1-methylphosphonate 5-triphosphate synthase subunit PhnL